MINGLCNDEMLLRLGAWLFIIGFFVHTLNVFIIGSPGNNFARIVPISILTVSIFMISLGVIEHSLGLSIMLIIPIIGIFFLSISWATSIVEFLENPNFILNIKKFKDKEKNL